jgi:hypothetical protein
METEIDQFLVLFLAQVIDECLRSQLFALSVRRKSILGKTVIEQVDDSYQHAGWICEYHFHQWSQVVLVVLQGHFRRQSQWQPCASTPAIIATSPAKRSTYQSPNEANWGV